MTNIVYIGNVHCVVTVVLTWVAISLRWKYIFLNRFYIFVVVDCYIATMFCWLRRKRDGFRSRRWLSWRRFWCEQYNGWSYFGYFAKAPCLLFGAGKLIFGISPSRIGVPFLPKTMVLEQWDDLPWLVGPSSQSLGDSSWSRSRSCTHTNCSLVEPSGQRPWVASWALPRQKFLLLSEYPHHLRQPYLSYYQTWIN